MGPVGRDSEPALGWRTPSGVPQTHPLGFFAPNGCHLRGVQKDIRHGCGPTRGALPRAKPGAAPPPRPGSLYSVLGAGWVSPALARPTRALRREHASPAFFIEASG